MSQLLGAMLAILLVYGVFGFALARLIGLRGLWSVAAAPAFATTVIGGSSVVAPWLGLRWSVLPPLLCAAVIAIAVVGVRLLLARRAGTTVSLRPFAMGAGGGWTLAALTAVAAVLGVRVLAVLGSPDAISQTFDNVFHLNAIRYIVDVGTASALEIGQMTSPGGGVPFYPAAWHATAALVVQLTGAAIPVAVNAQTIVIAAVVWPAAAVLLARTLAGRRPAVTVGAAVLSLAVPAFPFLPMDYGVLYPYQLSLALAPVALAATAKLLDVGTRDDGDRLAPGWWALVLLGSLPGVALAHPGGFVAWLALSVPMVLAFCWRVWRRAASWKARAVVAVSLLAYGGVGIVLLKILRPPLPTRLWPTITDPGSALVDAVTLTLYYPAPAWVAAAGAVLGLVWAAIDRTRGSFVMVAGWATGVLLFVVVTSSPWGNLRDALTGGWYNNWPRLAALCAVAVMPLAAYGIARTGEWLAGRVCLRAGAGAALGAAGAIALVVAAQPALQVAVDRAQRSFTMTASSPLLSDDETALLDRLDETVPEGAVIAGNPYTGAGLAYAYSGRPVLMPHILMDVSDDMAEVNDRLRDADEDPEVCDAVENLDVGFVLDFGEREVHGGNHAMSGLTDLQDSDAVRLVDQQGDARLFEVVACGQRDGGGASDD